MIENILMILDVVYVGCTTELHYSICLMLLDAGKHILCEKSITLSELELKKLCTLAKERKIFLIEVKPNLFLRELALFKLLQKILFNFVFM